MDMKIDATAQAPAPYYEPSGDEVALFEHHAGLIVLSGGIDGAIGQLLAKGQDERAEAVAQRYAQVLGDRYALELSRCGRNGEAEITLATAAIAGVVEHLIGRPPDAEQRHATSVIACAAARYAVGSR